MSPRQRIDVWLYRARLAPSRAAGTALVAAGGVRLTRAGASRRLTKAAAEVAVGDTLTLKLRGRLASVSILALGGRRGPPAEARSLYSEHDAEPSA